jgi:GPH family glycoside/pentoside/hexuronide:cation symporter
MNPTQEVSSDTHAAKLSRRTILGYSSGQLALNITYTAIGVHLTFLYCDVIKLSPILVGYALLIANAWDAITDPLMGNISDRIRWKYGRRRPFFGFGTPPMAIAFMLLLAPTLFPEKYLFICLAATILLLFTFRTIVETPYIALMPELTLDYDERTRISGYRQLFANSGDLIGAMGPLLLLGIFHDQIKTYQFFGIAAAIVATAAMLTAYRGTTESGHFEEKSALSLLEAFKATLTNKPYIILVAVLTLTIVANSITSALVLFVAKYWFGSEGLATYFFASFFIGAFISIPFWIKFTSIVGKKTAYLVNIVLYGFILCVIMILKQDAHIAATLVNGVAGFLNLGLWIISGSISADIIEWDQLKTGERREGSFAGIQAFVFKAAQGVGLALVNVALTFIGYVPDAPQSAETLFKLRFIYGPVSAVIFWIAAAVLLFYPITKKVYEQMLDELAAKK